tara:strand:+ start:941 stop:1123 length:183 start_codon:yes stop_codon:yes gene_type:complete
MADKATYLISLKKKHRVLDKEITTLYNQYGSEDLLKELKYTKLQLKMQIKNIERQIAEVY